MFCPQCATEVATGLQYCRSCGLSLTAVEAALDSRLSLAGSHLQRGASAIKFGLVWMGVFVIIAAIAALSSGAFDVTVGPLLIRVSDWGMSLILGLLVGIPAVAIGFRHIRQAVKKLPELDTPAKAESPGRRSVEAETARLAFGEGERRPQLDATDGSEDVTVRFKQTSRNDP